MFDLKERINKSISRSKSLSYFYRTVAAAAVMWTAAIVCSASWNVYHERQQTLELAKNEAIANFNKDLAFRLWGTKHGGVYVPPTEQTPPNPYLSHIPNRDLTLPSGKRLTLMNPAYMLRQLMTDYAALYGIKGRITSLKPLNPANTPDAWELKALTAFEKGAEEFFEITEHGGQQSLRLMRPMLTQAGCLKCHSHQGYKEGNIRGGVGVNVPMAPYLALQKKVISTILLSHLAIWLFGSTVLSFVFYRGKRHMIEQVQSAEALMQSEEFVNSIIENIPDMIFVKNAADLRFVRFNKAGEQLLGYSREELIGRNDYDFFPKSEADLFTMNDREVFSKNRLVDIHEETIRTRSGEERILHTKKLPILDKEGKPLYLLGISEDITERRTAEAELRKSTEMVERIFSMTTTCIAYLDRNFNFIRVNREYAASDEKQPEYFPGKNHFELYPNVENEAIFRRVVETGQSYVTHAKPFEYKDHPERGLTHWDWSLIPVTDQAGVVESLILSLINVTARIKAQEALGNLNVELERRVRERTAELQEKNAELDEKNRELEQFNKLFVNRELKMMELKERIRELEKTQEGPGSTWPGEI